MKTGNDVYAKDREDSTLKSHQFLSRKPINDHPILAHISTEQPCYSAKFSLELRLVLLSVLNCSVSRKILLVALVGYSVAAVRCDPSSCNPGCDVVESGQSVSVCAAEKNRAAASDPASNGGLQSQGQLLGWGGQNFLVWQQHL